MLPPSALSTAAYSLRKLFLQNIDELSDINCIRIGHPADNIKDLDEAEENCLNLFFYNVNYDGYPADGSNDDPFYVRLHCLITAFGYKSKEPESPGSTSERDVSKGENELRLIGEVMRILHQQPLLPVADSAGNEVAVLQVIPHTMSLDNLNHIWSTQTDISYRLSVAYEMALAPVPQAVAVQRSPLVGDSRMVSWGAMSRGPGHEQDGLIRLQPPVEYVEVDTDVSGWMPHICYLETPADSSRKLHYVFKLEGDLSAALDILIAGKAGGQVKLLWSVWHKKTDNGIVAWKEDIADLESPTEKTISNATDVFSPGTIDPDNIHNNSIFHVRLPVEINASDTKTWQALLHAVHEWVYVDPFDSSRTITTFIKSNTVMFYGVKP
ncbi:DUF4255 domain-containing protein [Desulfopila sp. IMCC35006]|uniref:DUF4255 domain-containing protein n=1 Tax=Desulfopila sp. IMCC35006 TaxID=2569542 RepID=UPI0010AB54D0|nr:DUF4255 domain-containing protein [Desulfopila sp. IMCC35006]TKB25866.1 DUF4255 domain-containing protein [Desulfopila sp. IMCC35006]